MSAESLSPRERYRELSRSFLTGLGAAPLSMEDTGLEYVATLPMIDEWTRLSSWDFSTHRVHSAGPFSFHLVDIPDSNVILLRVDGNVAKALLVQSNVTGWDGEDLERGFVYGFKEKPAIFDRVQRILKNMKDTDSRFTAVAFPVDRLDEHNLIKPVRLHHDEFPLEEDFG